MRERVKERNGEIEQGKRETLRDTGRSREGLRDRQKERKRGSGGERKGSIRIRQGTSLQRSSLIIADRGE